MEDLNVERFDPRGARILIRKTWDPAVRASGIEIPDTSRQRPMHGEVIAIGPGERDFRTGELVPVAGVRVGDQVIYHKYAGIEVKLNGDDNYVCLPDKEVVGVLHGER